MQTLGNVYDSDDDNDDGFLGFQGNLGDIPDWNWRKRVMNIDHVNFGENTGPTIQTPLVMVR